jgi:DUF438 domain-containing protein
MKPYEPDERLVQILQLTMKEDCSAGGLAENEYREYLLSVSPLDLALAEEELVKCGTGLGVLGRKLAQQVELLGNGARAALESLPDEHVLKRLIAEHRAIGGLLEKVEGLNSWLGQVSWINPADERFRELVHIAEHIHLSAKHTEAEEEIVFPVLERIGIEAIPELLYAEHFDISHYSTQYFELAVGACTKDPHKTARKMKQITAILVPLKRRHMLVEESLIYPIALEVADEGTWEALRRECEKAGFCCV